MKKIDQNKNEILYLLIYLPYFSPIKNFVHLNFIKTKEIKSEIIIAPIKLIPACKYGLITPLNKNMNT